MKKIVINSCFGGFGLSPLAVKKLAELKGRECYFFACDLRGENKPITLEQATKGLSFFAYSVPNPQDYDLNEPDEDGFYKSANERAKKISLDSSPNDRDDIDLIKVVEELGEKANGAYAELKIIEIPDDVDWEISEYDGSEKVEEAHRSWY